MTLEAVHATAQVDGIEMPHTRDMADRLCLRSTFSILANIPTEDVFEIDGHACISLNQLLD